jgi:ribosomal protein L28
MRHTKRRWNPNVQKTTVMVDGKSRSMAVCTSCIKTISKSR